MSSGMNLGADSDWIKSFEEEKLWHLYLSLIWQSHPAVEKKIKPLQSISFCLMQLEDGWIKDLICHFLVALKLIVSGLLKEISNQALEIR